jgi:hypothetical protein
LGRERINLLRVSSERVFYQQRTLLMLSAGVSKVGSVRCVPISKIPRQLIQFPFLMTSTPKTKRIAIINW